MSVCLLVGYLALYVIPAVPIFFFKSIFGAPTTLFNTLVKLVSSA